RIWGASAHWLPRDASGMRTAPEMVDLSTGHAVRVAFRSDARSAVGRDHFLALAHALRAFGTESLVLLAGPSGPPGDAGRGRARLVPYPLPLGELHVQ